MPNYYVANTPQPNGEHEVHRDHCQYLAEDHAHLGWYADCRLAVGQAKQLYPDSNGCYWCCRAAHTPPHGQPSM